jgi:hypothetical protein
LDGIAMPRLKSRHPFLAKLESTNGNRSLQPDPWKEEWKSDIPTNRFLMDNVHSKAKVGVITYCISGKSKQTLNVAVVQIGKRWNT